MTLLLILLPVCTIFQSLLPKTGYKTISKFLQLNFPVYISGGDTLKEMPMRTLSARVHWSKGLPNEE
jgi:hypothetical protein